MPKFFKVVDGVKLYCNADGSLVEKEGKHVEVPATDKEAVDIDQGADDVAKMLGEAMQKAIARGDQAAAVALEKSMESVTKLVEKIGEVAEKKTPKVEVTSHRASFDTEAFQKAIEPMIKGSKGSAMITIASKADLEYIGKSTSRDDLTGDVILPDRDTDITRAPVRSPFLEQIADTVPTDSDVVEWVEVTTETGAPATTEELALIPQKDYAFQTYRQPVEKIAVMNKHSIELLKHGPELVAAIRRMLEIDLNIVVDSQLLSGNGTAPNLQGVLGVAPVLDAAAIGAQVVPEANLFDVLRVAATKIAVAGKGQFIPNYVILNPVDTEKFDLTKDLEGRYIMPPFYDAAGRRVRGARIIENTGITAGTFLIGDFNYMHVRPKGGVEVELTNSDGTDFANDILSIKMRRFLAAYVKNNENGAFMTGNIATAITALAS